MIDTNETTQTRGTEVNKQNGFPIVFMYLKQCAEKYESLGHLMILGQSCERYDEPQSVFSDIINVTPP